MADLAGYPNPKKAIKALLTELAPRIGTRTPTEWNGDPHWLRYRVYGGSDNTVTDVTRFDIDALTTSEADSDELAENARQRVLASVGRNLDGYIVDTATCETRPHSVPWGSNSNIFNTTASYRISARRT